jgi:hypothetical protein
MDEPLGTPDIEYDAIVLVDRTLGDAVTDATADRNPERTHVFDSRARKITADCGTACAVLTSGSVYCWGGSSTLHNGGSSVEERLRPRRIEGLREIEQLSTSMLGAESIGIEMSGVGGRTVPTFKQEVAKTI